VKKLTILLCAMVLVCGIAVPVGADTIVLGVGGINLGAGGLTAASSWGLWTDVEQAASSNYCWLASTSNMLGYSGWDGGFGLTSAQAIYNYATGFWDNRNGSVYYAIEWWFDGNNSSALANHPEVSGGGDFYTEALWLANRRWASGSAVSGSTTATDNVVRWIGEDVRANGVFTMLMGDANEGVHFLTGWGYESDAAGDAIGVYYTDSLANADTLQYAGLDCTTHFGQCRLVGVYSDLWVLEMGYAPYNTNNEPPNGTAVPEPSTLILFGSGLLAVVSRRRKK
jgi:hypothetical protein